MAWESTGAGAAAGQLVCGHGENTGSYNSNTGTMKETETNDYGVKTTKTGRGGQAKTQNGVSMLQTPAAQPVLLPTP